MLTGVRAENIIAFGPVPSRRLGRSLGINNIPAKTCTYSCIYCQLGRRAETCNKRRRFYEPELIFRQVKEKIEQSRAAGESIDYLAFVPDGEPTLDVNLGQEIEMLKPLGFKIAVLTNASLIGDAEVESDLATADLVSLKIDAVSEDVWRQVNRPHRSLDLHSLLEGIREFARDFKGQVISETMLIDGVNDRHEEIRNLGEYLSNLRLSKAYVAIPTRPPAENWIRAASDYTINLAYQTLSGLLGSNKVEFLIGYEGDAFTSTGNIEEDLLSITSVHPMRREAMVGVLRKANQIGDWWRS